MCLLSSLSLGGGVHNILWVWVCAAHMGGFLGPKFSRHPNKGETRVHFSADFLKHGWIVQKLAKWLKIGGFPPKFLIKAGMTASFGNYSRRGHLSDDRADEFAVFCFRLPVPVFELFEPFAC